MSCLWVGLANDGISKADQWGCGRDLVTKRRRVVSGRLGVTIGCRDSSYPTVIVVVGFACLKEGFCFVY